MLTRSGWCHHSDLRKRNYLEGRAISWGQQPLWWSSLKDPWLLDSMVAFSHIYSTFSASQLGSNNRARDQIRKKKAIVEVKKDWFPPSCQTTDYMTALFPHRFPWLLWHSSSCTKDHVLSFIFVDHSCFAFYNCTMIANFTCHLLITVIQCHKTNCS